MSQYQNAPGASQEDFNNLSEQLAKDWVVAKTWLESIEQGTDGNATAMFLGDRITQINIITASRAHANDDYIMTIPSGHRP